MHTHTHHKQNVQCVSGSSHPPESNKSDTLVWRGSLRNAPMRTHLLPPACLREPVGWEQGSPSQHLLFGHIQRCLFSLHPSVRLMSPFYVCLLLKIMNKGLLWGSGGRFCVESPFFQLVFNTGFSIIPSFLLPLGPINPLFLHLSPPNHLISV